MFPSSLPFWSMLMPLFRALMVPQSAQQNSSRLSFGPRLVLRCSDSSVVSGSWVGQVSCAASTESKMVRSHASGGSESLYIRHRVYDRTAMVVFVALVTTSVYSLISSPGFGRAYRWKAWMKGESSQDGKRWTLLLPALASSPGSGVWWWFLYLFCNLHVLERQNTKNADDNMKSNLMILLTIYFVYLWVHIFISEHYFRRCGWYSR